jgi:hypothetical protein
MKLDDLIAFLSDELETLGDQFEPNRCYLCWNARKVCPRCTDGKIGIEFKELFMGCGELIRCPVCVDPMARQKMLHSFVRLGG